MAIQGGGDNRAPADKSGKMNVHLGRVLVVDDDLAIRRVCARVLNSEGWTVVLADHGRAAIAEVEAAKAPFDCVLSDVNMPGLDGFGLVRELRLARRRPARAAHDRRPVDERRSEALDQGAISYITKPFHSDELAAAVARAARLHGVKRMRRQAESLDRELYGGTVPIARRSRLASTSARAIVDGLSADRRGVDTLGLCIRGAVADRGRIAATSRHLHRDRRAPGSDPSDRSHRSQRGCRVRRAGTPTTHCCS